MSTYWITVLISLLIFVIVFVFLRNCTEYGETQPIKIKRKWIILVIVGDFIFGLNVALTIVMIVAIITCLFVEGIIYSPMTNFIRKIKDWLNSPL